MNERFQKIMHFLAGVLVVMNGLNHFEAGYGAVWFYLIVGILMLTIAFFQDSLEKNNPKLSGVFYWIEGIVIFFIAFEMFESYKKYLPWVYALLGIFYFITGYMMMQKKIKIKKR